MNKIFRYIKQRGAGEFIVAISLSSLFLGYLSFLAPLYKPVLIMCILVYCTKLKKACVGWVEIMLIILCAVSIIFGNPLPVFSSWMRLGLFCIVIFVTTPLVSSPAINIFRVRLFNWVSLICIFTGLGSFFAYFLGVNCMRSVSGDYFAQLGGSFGGLTMQSMLLGPLSALGMLNCVYVAVQRYGKGVKSSYFLYGSAFACFASVLMASSRGAASSAVIATCYMIYSLLRRKMGKLIKIIVCVSCLAVPLAPAVGYFSSGLLAKQQGNVANGGTFNSRERLWKARLDEFLDSPIYGVGFSAQRVTTSKSTLQTGLIEPGTSYGAVFAMTGMLGGLLFLFILFKAICTVGKSQPSLPQIYLVFFAVHMFVEGYVFAGGSPLCFIFWLCIGAACAIKNNQQLNQLIA